jgi:hypothetical protein
MKLNLAPTEKVWRLKSHNCFKAHRTHTALAKCRWPRRMGVHGDGCFGVYVEGAHHYATGTKAAWPDIHLFWDYDEACDFYERVREEEQRGLERHRSRQLYIFEFPEDPGDADEYEDRSLAGIRSRRAMKSYDA